MQKRNGAVLMTMVPKKLPVPGRVTSWSGEPRSYGPHKGVDFAGPVGGMVVAVAPGRVAGVWKDGAMQGYGNTVVVKHPDGTYTLYAHLDAIIVAPGDRLVGGQSIGTVGRTAATRANPGRTVPPHLHFEALSKWPPGGRTADRLDPVAYLGIGRTAPPGRPGGAGGVLLAVVFAVIFLVRS